MPGMRKRWPQTHYSSFGIDSGGTPFFEGKSGKYQGILDDAYVTRLNRRLSPRERHLVALWREAYVVTQDVGFGFAFTGLDPEEHPGRTMMTIEMSGYERVPDRSGGLMYTGRCFQEAEVAAKRMISLLQEAGFESELDWIVTKPSEYTVDEMVGGKLVSRKVKDPGGGCHGYVRVLLGEPGEAAAAMEFILANLDGDERWVERKQN